MAGDPDPETSLAILKALPAAGADIVELGMPFTDPMADGPAIQAAGLRALKAGQTTADDARARAPLPRRRTTTRPSILMGYFNPIYVYGVERFLADAKSAGVDGLIVVDLPPEEDDELCLPALAAGLAFIRLATPTTDDRRLPAVLANTAGFVYYVSITGITGAATPDFGQVADAVARIKRHTDLPVVVGFGVKTGAHAAAIAAGRRRRRGRLGAGRRRPGLARCRGPRDLENGRGSGQVGARAGGRRALGLEGQGGLADDVMPALSRPRLTLSAEDDGQQERSMNWISEVVRPKIKTLFKRETPGQSLDQMPGYRADGVPQGCRGESLGDPRLEPPHADRRRPARSR